jgi:hypothetical protein
MPPVCGSIAFSSANVSAPHNATSPPATHSARMSVGEPMFRAIVVGVAKMPLPMTTPTITAVAPQNPTLRGSSNAATGTEDA